MNSPVASRGSEDLIHRDSWLPADALDQWWLVETTPTAGERLRGERRACLRRIARWLFVNGGISVVLLSSLMAFGLLAAFFKSR